METIIKELEKRIQTLVAAFSQEVGGMRSNRPSPALVEDLKIEYFGSQVPIKQLGNISAVPPRELIISLWDPGSAAQVAKAIDEAKRGFTASVNGGTIRINLPPLSEERRVEMVKILKFVAEDARVKVRSARDDANKKVEAGESAGAITEDQRFRGKKKIQEIVDKGNKDIEAQVEKKSKEFFE